MPPLRTDNHCGVLKVLQQRVPNHPLEGAQAPMQGVPGQQGAGAAERQSL